MLGGFGPCRNPRECRTPLCSYRAPRGRLDTKFEQARAGRKSGRTTAVGWRGWLRCRYVARSATRAGGRPRVRNLAGPGACPSNPRGRALGNCARRPGARRKVMRFHQRRRATPHAAASPRARRVSAAGGRLRRCRSSIDGEASTSSRRLASDPPALETRPRGSLGQAPGSRFHVTNRRH